MNTKATRIIENSDIFEGRSPRIQVRCSEHNGSVWRHYHRFTELVFINSGFALHGCLERTDVLTAGDIFVIPPNCVHSYFSAHNATLYNCLFMTEDIPEYAELVASLPGAALLTGGGSTKPIRIFKTELSGRLEMTRLFESIITEKREMKPGWESAVKSLLVSVIVRFCRLYNAQNDPSKQNNGEYTGYIFRTIKYIAANYTAPLTRTDIAAAVGVSPDYISRHFAAVMGVTPVEYLREYRISKAADLLRDTDLPVSDIAGKVGYKDLSLFSRIFHQITDLSPAAFRRKAQALPHSTFVKEGDTI